MKRYGIEWGQHTELVKYEKLGNVIACKHENTSNWQSCRGETMKSCEMVQSWHTDLVKYEKRDKVIACKHYKYVKLTKSSQ